MNYLSVTQCAQQWGIHPRTVQRQCRAGCIPGSIKLGNNWLIPACSEKPTGYAVKEAPKVLQDLVWIAPSFPSGQADAFLQSLPRDKVYWMTKGFFAYNRCEYEEALDCLRPGRFNGAHPSLAILYSMYAAICAGNYELYRKMRSTLESIQIQYSDTAELRLIWECIMASINCSLCVLRNIPDWLVKGDLTGIPPPLRDLGWYTYVRYLQLTKDYRVMLAASEARLSVTRKPGHYSMCDIYMNLYSALGFIKLGNASLARDRMMTAMRLALPDGFISPFAETMTTMQGLTERCLLASFPHLYDQVVSQWKRIFPHWLHAHNEFAQYKMPDILTRREYQITLFVADGLSNSQIAQKMFLSISTIKADLSAVYDKLGISCRRELKQLIE